MSASARPPSAATATRPAVRAPALPRLRAALAAAALAVALFAALWLSLASPSALALDVGTAGSGDRIFLRGVYHREVVAPNDPGARTYRWARGDAEVLLPVGRTGPAIFTATMNAAPQPADQPLAFAMSAGATLLRFEVPATVRSYHVLLPETAVEAGLIRLRFASPTVTPAGDNRLLAVALDRVGVQPVAGLARPALPLVLVQLALVAMAAALLRINGARPRVVIAGALAMTALLAGLNLGARAWSGLGVWPLALVGATLVAASLLAQRILPRDVSAEARFARWLWLISLCGLALRLIGVSAPGFEFNDLDIQSIIIGQVQGGEIYLFVGAHEFGGGTTFYPTGPYLLALPLLLIQPQLPFALHSGAALLDACGPALLALIARELQLGRRAALIAAGLLAVLPIQLTALWWGFFTNIGGQMLFLLLLWLLLRHMRAPGRTSAALLFLGFCLVALSHVGVMILTSTAAAFTLGLAWLRPRPAAAAWRSLLLAGIAAGAVCVLFYLSVVAAPMFGATRGVLSERSSLSAEQLAEHRAYIVRILPVALWRGVGMLPFLMLLPGIPLILARARRPLGRAVVLGWLITPFVFALVDYANTLQVRYIYFLAPLCCLAFATVLHQLWAYRAARPVVVAAVLLIGWLGVFLWYRGAILGIKMSLVPLTH